MSNTVVEEDIQEHVDAETVEVVSEEGAETSAEEEFVDTVAKVHGETVTSLPPDLYIPPDALEVFLEAFEGPLDLLLYMIKRQNLDILDIPITQITEQYMEYVEMMKEIRLELAAEYLVMAAALAEIKSRMLLPRPVEVDGDEEDPRAELVRRLQEYERFKQAAQDIDALQREGRDVFPASAQGPDRKSQRPEPEVDLRELLLALSKMLKRAELVNHHMIEREPLSLRDRMTQIVARVTTERFMDFSEFFTPEEGKPGVVVTFIALLELLRESIIELVQAEPYSPIHVRQKA